VFLDQDPLIVRTERQCLHQHEGSSGGFPKPITRAGKLHTNMIVVPRNGAKKWVPEQGHASTEVLIAQSSEL